MQLPLHFRGARRMDRGRGGDIPEGAQVDQVGRTPVRRLRRACRARAEAQQRNVRRAVAVAVCRLGLIVAQPVQTAVRYIP